jgi:hypothetical protein
MQQIIFFLPLSHKTQNVSALDGHLQVSQYVEEPEYGHLGQNMLCFMWKWKEKNNYCITDGLWYTQIVYYGMQQDA